MGLPPQLPHDALPYGASEACGFNDHNMCRSPRCGCSCHTQARQVEDLSGVDRVAAPRAIAAAIAIDKSLSKSCPVCKGKFPGGQNYCKQDGVPLSSLLCPQCTSVFELGDIYCGYCGEVVSQQRRDQIAAERAASPVGSVAEGIPAAIPTPRIPELAGQQPAAPQQGQQPQQGAGQPAKMPNISVRMFKT